MAMAKAVTMGDIERCESVGREKHSVVADLEGGLLRDNTTFIYFFLVALEGGSLARAIALLLCYPLVWLLGFLISEAAGTRVLVFVALAGLHVTNIEGVARAVLPKFFSGDVHPHAWSAFSSCQGEKRCVVTCIPRLMVEPFALGQLGATHVLGTELHVLHGGRASGLIQHAILAHKLKRNAVKVEFGGVSPNLGIASSSSSQQHHNFLSLCKESYIVSKKVVDGVPMKKLANPIIFHDGRLIPRPTPTKAFLICMWMPLGFLLALLRILICGNFPVRHILLAYRLSGCRLKVNGTMPIPMSKQTGTLFVCNHRTLLDPVILSIALRRPVVAVTYSVSRVTEILSPIRTVRLTRDRDIDAHTICKLLQEGDLVICPEGTTCREPYLLRFSALFTEMANKIVPVALSPQMNMFHGSTVRGWKGVDPFFFFMNPSPCYEVSFLDPISLEPALLEGRSSFEVANHIQRVIADALGYECTSFTRRDKYKALANKDGYVHTTNNNFSGGFS